MERGKKERISKLVRQRNAQTEEVRNLLYEKLKTVSSQETLYIEDAQLKYKYIPTGDILQRKMRLYPIRM